MGLSTMNEVTEWLSVIFFLFLYSLHDDRIKLLQVYLLEDSDDQEEDYDYPCN